MDNSEGKSHHTIPYIIINLDYEDPVYIGKNTPLAYIKDEEVSCEYLEVNEICEPVNGQYEQVCRSIYRIMDQSIWTKAAGQWSIYSGP